MLTPFTGDDMSNIISNRMTAQMDNEFVVFLIGMRVNRWWKLHKWISVAAAMPRMIQELNGQPESGFLGAEQWLGRTTIMLQYWRSMDELMKYAKNRDAKHLPAWRAFNRSVGTSGDVGIWHETYRVRPGDYENVYVNMMPFGLGNVGKLVTAGGNRATASRRLAAPSSLAAGTVPNPALSKQS
jgi:hypothetical protein